MRIAKKVVLVVVAVGALSSSGWAQGRSPFTSFGIGELYGNSLIHNQGMGGIGVAQPEVWYLNNQNPALLTYNQVTVFQAGMVGESRKVSNGSSTEKSTGGNLNYLVTAFPIRVGEKQPLTTSLGLMPYSSVNYATQYADYSRNPDGTIIDTLNVRETGSGGLTQFYWSNGVKLTKTISFGLKAAYLFGPIERSYANNLTNTDTRPTYLVTVNDKTSVKDFLFTMGLSYSKDSLWRKDAYRFSVGATYTFATKLGATRRLEITRSTGGVLPIERDTLQAVRGSLSIPAGLNVGISLAQGSKWMLGTEFSYQNWSEYRGIEGGTENQQASWRGAFGGEFTPDAFAVENYLKRISFRAGIAYERYPYLVNGNQVNDFGINFGFSLPTGRSSLDMAFKVGKRADRAQNILEENYFKVYFGITFNDQWFIKRKFD